MTLAVDFDGTLCVDIYPEIGLPYSGVIDAVKEFQNAGGQIILWTCRNKEPLNEAVEWCEAHGLFFDAINENLPEVQLMYGGDTRKVFADYYLDDKSLLVSEVNAALEELRWRSKVRLQNRS